jgi:hypothetical protein
MENHKKELQQRWAEASGSVFLTVVFAVLIMLLRVAMS